MELVRAWVAATPTTTRHTLPRVTQCGWNGRLFTRPLRRPATLIAHCASSSSALPMSLVGQKPMLWHLVPVSSFHIPMPRIFPTAGAPTRPPNCTVQPTISRPWLEIVSTPSVRVYAQSTPTHSVSYFPPAPGPDRTVTSKFQICFDVHLNDGLEPNCG